MNIEVRSETDCLYLGERLEGLFQILPEGSALQALMSIAPATSAPVWESARAHSDAAHVPWQRQAITAGLPHYEGATLAGRLREFRTYVTVRLPLSALRTPLLHMLRTMVDPTAAAVEAITTRLRQLVTQQLAEFARLCMGVEQALGLVGLTPVRLQAPGILASLAQGLTPQQTDRPVWDPTMPLGAQALLEPLRTVPGGICTPQLRAHVLSLRSAPKRTYPGLLSAPRAPQGAYPLAVWDLAREWPVTICANVVVPSQASCKTQLEWKRTFAVLQRITMFGSTSVEADTISHELDTLLGDAFRTGRRVLKVRVHIVLWGPSVDHLRTLEDRVIQAGVSLDLQFLREPTLGATLFLHTLPLGFDPIYPKEDELRRGRTLPADNAAHLLPLYGGFRGTTTPAALYLNRRGETVLCDHFDFPTAPHALVTGTSGAGKSFFVNHFVQQVLPLGASVVIFDRLASYEGLCAVHGGRYITVDFDHPICSNPFVGPFDASHRAFLARLLTAMASQDEDHISVEERGIFAEALGIFAQHRPYDREPTLSDFIPLLRDTNFEWMDQGRRLALRLAPFYGDGPYAGFVDGPNAFELHERLTVVELSQLREAPDLQTVLMLVLMHHLTLYFAAPARRHRRKYMFNDEVWALMQHPVSARILVEMARTFRKLRTSAIFISQQGTDYAGPAGQAIKANTSVAYFLQQDTGEIEMLRTLFDLTPAEVDLIKTVSRRPQWSEAYVRLLEQKGGVIRLIPDPYLRYMATQDPLELAAREATLDAADGDLHTALCQLAHDAFLKKEPLV